MSEEQQLDSEVALDMSPRIRSVFLGHPTGEIEAPVRWSTGGDGDVRIESRKACANGGSDCSSGSAIVGLASHRHNFIGDQ